MFVFVVQNFKSTSVNSYNLSSHYRSLATRGAPQLGVVVTLASISKIIREARTLDTGMSLHGFIIVIIQIIINK